MFIEVVTCLKCEGLLHLLSKPRMANGAGIQALLAAKFFCGDQEFCILLLRVFSMTINMIGRGPMASFAVNSVNDLCFIKGGNIVFILQHLCISAVTFQALRRYNTIEPDKAVGKARTIAPSVL